MDNDWIMFYSNGQVVLDIVIGCWIDVTYPRGKYYITPRYGKVPAYAVIQLRHSTDHG